MKQEEKNEVSKEPLLGTVVACSTLNLREQATKESKSLSILKVGEKMEVILNSSTKDFYRVKTSAGLEGFCMKQYISLEQ